MRLSTKSKAQIMYDIQMSNIAGKFKFPEFFEAKFNILIFPGNLSRHQTNKDQPSTGQITTPKPVPKSLVKKSNFKKPFMNYLQVKKISFKI